MKLGKKESQNELVLDHFNARTSLWHDLYSSQDPHWRVIQDRLTLGLA